MRSSSTSCSSNALQFIFAFAATVVVGVALLEWSLRSLIHDQRTEALLAKRVAAIYEPRTWPVMGDSFAAGILIGDSQMYTGFYLPEFHPAFFKLALSAETAPMLEILVREYFRFRTPKRAVIAAGPQLFAQRQLNNGARKHDTYFKQNNWLQHATGIRLYAAEPGIGSFVGEATGALIAKARLVMAAVAQEEVQVPDEPLAHWGLYSAAQRRYLAASRATVQTPIPGFESTSHFAAYRRMVEFLAERGAELCFLRMPLVPEYLDAIAQDEGFNRAYAAFRELARSYGAPYVDFTGLDIEYAPEHFWNQDHLTVAAAAVFAPRALTACFGALEQPKN
jgi:hypothetical protein